MVCPNPREAIGLKLDPNLEPVSSYPVQFLLHLLRLGQNTQEILDMMPNFMSNHVSLRELAGLG